MRTLESRLLLAFLAGAAALLATVAFAVVQGFAYVDADRRIDDLRNADLAVSRFYLAVRSAESGQRGYLLTGDDRYLTPYRLAIADTERLYANALDAAAIDPDVGDAVQAMEAPMRHLVRDFARAIDARRTSGLDAAVDVMTRNDDATAMRTIRETSDAVHATMATRVAADIAATERKFSRAVVWLAVVIALVVALLAAGYVAMVAELRARRRIARIVEREANHDALTGLPNRRFLNEWLAYALAQAQRDQTLVALLAIDLDGFKRVNDTRGHDAGDAVLVDVAERFRAVKRDADVLARVGGDEFVIAVAGASDGREIAALGERLIAALGAAGERKAAGVGASVGIAFFPDDADDLAGLMAAADAAMYTAKRAGRNRVAFHALADTA
ncbi:MAG: diguanylate cyclase [Proteobacteria bacterium]|nr:diguanylate cyclase [Pseudomonadota bacterium]